MDGDGSDFTFTSATEYTKGQDATDISWADIFLDGIHSDDATHSEQGSISSLTSNLGASIHGNTQQMHQQSQQSMMGGQLQFHLPSHLQGSVTSNAVQQAGTKLGGTVTYLTPSISTHQHVNAAGGIQNMMTLAGHHQVGASVGQQQQQQNSAKLVQIASSFPVTQTLLQSNQAITGQTIYGSQGGGLFPAQGSVHIENPKVVNVNFGPHVIGSDGSGQQAIFQTAEGKRVLITNSQLQQMAQSISLNQPLVGTQLFSAGGGNLIRASLTPGTHTIMSSNTTQPRQIVLPSGQTVISQQTNSAHGELAKNMVLRPLNANMSPVIYQSGQGGQLIHSQPTLITSGQGLQVVNTGGGQSNHVQLIAQPSINHAGMGQQQGTVMNLINNSGAGNQISGLMPGQNIIVNGQVLSFGQLGSLTVPQLHVQRNSQGGVTLSDLNATMINNSGHFQTSAPQLVIQQNGQQQQIVLQPKNNQSPSLMTQAVPSQRFIYGFPGSKNARTPTPNASSASSTPVLTPTPSTPTPTQTPELVSDFSGNKSSQGINLLKQALDMSDIDLQSFEDDISSFDDSSDCFSMIATQPQSQTSVSSTVKPAVKPKNKSKNSKPKLKNEHPIVSLHNSSVPFQQTAEKFQNTREQNITLSPQQKVITANGQVYVLSANGQQFILQKSINSAGAIAPQLKPIASVASSTAGVIRTQSSIPSTCHLEIKGLNQQSVNQSACNSSLDRQLKLEHHNVPISLEQKNVFITANAGVDGKVYLKTSYDETGGARIETSNSSVTSAQIVFSTGSGFSSPSVIYSQNLAGVNQMQTQQMGNQRILTLGSTFVKQEPVMSVIKQERDTYSNPSVSHVQFSPHTAASVSVSHSSLSTPNSNFSAMTTPLMSSGTFTAVVTTTTQSHHSTIMCTSQTSSTPQMSVCSTGTYMSHSSPCDVSCAPASSDYHIQNMSPTLLNDTNCSAVSNVPITSKSNSKEKDPANVKAMIPIQIADSTLMLSLTPMQKERLQSQLSRMSRKDQEGFLIHQQNVIRRSQQMQQKQLQQQKQQLQLQQTQEFPQQFHQTQTQQLQQLSQHQPSQLTVSQQQLSRLQTFSSAETSVQSFHSSSRSELLSPQAEAAASGLPTTVQELMEKSEEKEAQLNYQQHSALMPSEQSQHLHHTSSLEQSELQQQIYSSLQLGTASVTPSSGTVQPLMVPQIGRCLAEQQLSRDRNLAVDPDLNSPFKSSSDAMRRLVRYHTMQDHKPEEGSKAVRTWDTRYSKLCDYLVKKKRCYMKRFNKMRLYHDMCPEKQPEHIQNLMCFNEQLRALIDREKEAALTQPDLFAPIDPASAFTNSWSTTSVAAGQEDVDLFMETMIDSSEEQGVHVIKHKHLAVRQTPSPDPDSGSECVRPSSRKRSISDRGSTGMLKLVFKRGTTDNFVVKNSSANVNVLPRDLRPVVDLEKSDSEYEFDSSAADVAHNHPVIVRRRTLSVTSRRTSFTAGSDSNSVNSRIEDMNDNSSEEEDVDEERSESIEEREEENDLEKSYDDDDDEFVEATRQSKHRYHVSFGDDVENSGSMDIGSDSPSSVDTDALMEAHEMVSKSAFQHCIDPATGAPENSFTCTDERSLDNHNAEFKSSRHLSHSAAVSSSDIFNSNLIRLHSGSVPKDQNRDYNLCSNAKSVDRRKFSFKMNTHNVPGTYGQSSLPAQDEEYIAESPVGSLEEPVRTGLPSSSLFNTSNKSLLETDDMFNSEDEEEAARGSNSGMISKFQIDNKDPQSSMIDDSVRSVINSVLNDDLHDDMTDKDSQISWASSSNRLPSSSTTGSFSPNK